MFTWGSNSMLVKNICKFNANFTRLAKIIKKYAALINL